MVLNGWQRLGIVLTVLWAVAVVCFASYEYSTARSSGTFPRDAIFVGFSADAFLDDQPDVRMLRVGRLLTALAAVPTAAWLLIGLP